MPSSKHSIITPLVSQKKLQRLSLGMHRAQHGELIKRHSQPKPDASDSLIPQELRNPKSSGVWQPTADTKEKNRQIYLITYKLSKI